MSNNLEKCKRCGKRPECGPVKCELCRVEGCDYCVPETDCGHDICLDCIDKAREKAEQMLKSAGCIDADGNAVMADLPHETQPDTEQ